jgi:hypothetical protein
MLWVIRAWFRMQPSEITAWSICAPLIFDPGKKRGRAERARPCRKIEPWQFARHIQIGFKESANGPDVFPVTLENEREHRRSLMAG